MMPVLNDQYYSLMNEVQKWMDEVDGLTPVQIGALYVLFDKALKQGYIDGLGDLANALADKKE